MEDDKQAYSLTYDRLAIEEFSHLDVFWQDAARAAIESKLCVDPGVFGKPLRHTLKGCRTLRVGEYRVVFQIHLKTVRVVAIIHRSSDYRSIERRL